MSKKNNSPSQKRFSRRRLDAIRDLIPKVRGYCDPKTGRVIKPIPEEIFGELKYTQLCTGIFMGKDRPCRHLGTPLWFFIPLSGKMAVKQGKLRKEHHRQLEYEELLEQEAILT